jgi:hypothetical protein
MNTYDPADYILYVSMDGKRQPSVDVPPRDFMEHRLPQGYANGSPRTRLRNCVAVRPSRPHGQSPLQPLAAPIGPGEPIWLPRANGMA